MCLHGSLDTLSNIAQPSETTADYDKIRRVTGPVSNAFSAGISLRPGYCCPRSGGRKGEGGAGPCG